ncbi:ribonuclease E/G [Asticcacaulis sp. EMRT-3]|uniref:ribonuclease E/G n=1 Tax=Asticcacaulis sp. EMRT-3 TaxID=3040349 RepID=UPI0024AF9DE0|nr:ribonuclease E/G [Asticcacaulis sp. EMRT-3]MDI7774974.1 ribonuclease E/G [Asticcacaulis sp. EMRT-3]
MSLAWESRFGLARGAVFVHGRPHIYLEGLEVDPALDRLGAVSVARLRTKAGGIGFLGLADGAEAVLDAPQPVLAGLDEGAALEIEIVAEARTWLSGGKLARARLIAQATGDPRPLSAPQSLHERLVAAAAALGAGDDGHDDPDALDEAEAEAFAPSGPMAGGGYLSLEPTRALIACDIDAGGHDGVATARAFAKSCNERAMSELARRLRLSGLGGLVVVDLIGRRHDGARLTGLLRHAAGPEADRLVIGPLGKFGTLECVWPWTRRPLADSAASPLRAAHLLLREAVRRAEPGRLLTLRGPQTVLDKVRPLLAGSHDPLAAVIRLETGTKPEVILS